MARKCVACEKEITSKSMRIVLGAPKDGVPTAQVVVDVDSNAYANVPMICTKSEHGCMNALLYPEQFPPVCFART